jgi:hypothetical protein
MLMSSNTVPLCNSSLNGQPYYTSGNNVLSGFGAVLGEAGNLISIGVSTCCFLMWLLLAISFKDSAMNAGKFVIYSCILSTIFTIISSTVGYFKDKKKLQEAFAKGRPCKDSSGKVVT